MQRCTAEHDRPQRGQIVLGYGGRVQHQLRQRRDAGEEAYPVSLNGFQEGLGLEAGHQAQRGLCVARHMQDRLPEDVRRRRDHLDHIGLADAAEIPADMLTDIGQVEMGQHDAAGLPVVPLVYKMTASSSGCVGAVSNSGAA